MFLTKIDLCSLANIQLNLISVVTLNHPSITRKTQGEVYGYQLQLVSQFHYFKESRLCANLRRRTLKFYILPEVVIL